MHCVLAVSGEDWPEARGTVSNAAEDVLFSVTG